MALEKIAALPQDWTAEPDNVNTVSTADEIKQKMMDNPEHIKTFLDSLIDIFNSTTAGSSGTENLAARAIAGVTGATAYAQILDIKRQLDAAIFGSIPDGSLTDAKLSDAADQIKARFASHLNDYAQDTGTANAYAITLDPAPTAYEIGKIYKFKASNTNTGASTFAIGGLAVTAIKKNVSVDLAEGDIPAGAIIPVMYDGTNFQLIPMTPPSDASETVKGIVKLATAAETTTGTSTTLAVHPSGLKVELDKKAQVATGSYTGDGTTNRTIDMGVRPKVVILLNTLSASSGIYKVAIDVSSATYSFGVSSGSVTVNDGTVTITSSGITVTGVANTSAQSFKWLIIY